MESLVGFCPAPTLFLSGLHLSSPSFCSPVMPICPSLVYGFRFPRGRPGRLRLWSQLSLSTLQCQGVWRGFCRYRGLFQPQRLFLAEADQETQTWPHGIKVASLFLRNLKHNRASHSSDVVSCFSRCTGLSRCCLPRICPSMSLCFPQCVAVKWFLQSPLPPFGKQFPPLQRPTHQSQGPRATSERTNHRLKLQPFRGEESLIWA